MRGFLVDFLSISIRIRKNFLEIDHYFLFCMVLTQLLLFPPSCRVCDGKKEQMCKIGVRQRMKLRDKNGLKEGEAES
jgi:hypothetical protein